MEAQRIVLIGAMAVLAYLMILAWNDDYGQPASNQQSTEISNYSTLPAESLDISDSSDIPTAELAPEAAQPLATTQTSNSNTPLVLVETDVLRLAIDPRGGDIVQADLKDYPTSIERPDQPLHLLDNGRERLYVAQSGLIGEDGPDQASRPT